jgi:hypothetical protein
VSGSGPITEALADDGGAGRRRALLDAVAVAITRLGDDLSGWTPGELAQLHEMGLDLAKRTNLALAEWSEPR